MSQVINSEPLEFLLQVGGRLHHYGAAAHHIEAALAGLANSFCEDGEFFVTPTAIICSVKVDGQWQSRTKRMKPAGTDLGKLSLSDELGDLVVTGRLSLKDGLKEIQKIDETPERPYDRLFKVLFFILSSSAFSCFFVYKWSDVFAVFLLAVVASLFLEIDSRWNIFKETREFVLAALMSFLAFGMTQLIDDLPVNSVILSNLIVLIPGLSITIALSEIATNNWLAGTSRLMGALAELLKITFGVVMGSFAAKAIFATEAPAVIGEAGGLLPQSVILLGCSLSLSYLLGNRLRDYVWVVIGAFLAFYAVNFGNGVFGKELGVFCGGAVLSSFSNCFARFLKRPALTILIPGLIPMVPGSIGYRSLTFMYHQDIMGAMASTFSLVIVAVALVAGLTIGNMFVHPRRSI